MKIQIEFEVGDAILLSNLLKAAANGDASYDPADRAFLASMRIKVRNAISEYDRKVLADGGFSIGV